MYAFSLRTLRGAIRVQISNVYVAREEARIVVDHKVVGERLRGAAPPARTC